MHCEQPFCLANQNVLLTGATGGIGQAIAHVFARAGATLVLTDVCQERLDTLAQSIRVARTQVGDVHTIVTSLNDDKATEGLIPTVDAMTGGVDVLLNNAGITRDSMGHKMSDEAWHDVIHLNLTTAFRLCRAAVKSMAQRSYGRIINTTSVVALTGNIGQVNYGASKAGLIGITKAFALENVTKGITVNAIAPGFISTPMTESIPEHVMEKIRAKIPAKTMGKPEDVAIAALFLASQAAAYITGQTLHVNGGLLMP